MATTSISALCVGIIPLESYRFGFNGKEKDKEIYGESNTYDFGARIYDPRLGRWLSLDPLQMEYPDLAPYQFCANSPLLFIDPDGKIIEITDPSTGSVYIYTPNMKVPEGSSRFVSDAIMGLDYLNSSGVDKNGVNRVSDLVKSETTLSLIQSSNLQTEFSPMIDGISPGTLSWENRTVEVYEGGGYQTAIVGLAHDVDHAWRSITGWDKLNKIAAEKGDSDPETAWPRQDAGLLDPPYYEGKAIEYESFIGSKKVDDKYLSTHTRPSDGGNNYPPESVYQGESIFTPEESSSPDADLQLKIDETFPKK